MSDIEILQKNYETFTTVLQKLENKGLIDFVEELGDDLVMSPAAAQKDEYGCFSGGIIDMALKLSQSMRKLDMVAGYNANVESIYKVAFLRAIAECGDSKERMFEPHDSDWHIEKLGLLYKRNPKLNGTTWTTRAIEIATVKQINLNSEEVMALLTAANEHPYNDLARLLKSANTLLVK
tara:strand:- start:7463 stop:7999 length:537 start_codon:yes stop_codon:yes gene_type:complete